MLLISFGCFSEKSLFKCFTKDINEGLFLVDVILSVLNRKMFKVQGVLYTLPKACTTITNRKY